VNITAARHVRAGLALAVVGVVGWLVGCSDQPGGPNADLQVANSLIVSDPVPASAVSSGARAAARAGSAEQDVVYVSLPPGAAPTGSTATIRRLGDAESISTPVFDGGFDPVPLAAAVADSIDVVVTDAQGDTVLQAHLAVGARRPPVVVRTDPPRKKTDVPLNSAIVIVFSEPVAEGTLTSSSVRLFRGTSVVAGAVSPLQGTATAAVFVPVAALDPNTDYRLEVTRAVRDLGGDALAAATVLEFTTGTSEVGRAHFVTVLPDSVAIAVGSQVQLIAAARDSAGLPTSGRPITWSSLTPATATVSAFGLVTALGEGEARVRADVDVGSGVGVIQIAATLEPVGSVQVVPDSATLLVSGTIRFNAVLRDAAGNVLRFRPVAWSTSASTVATVDPGSAGRTVVTGVSPGAATITATSDGVSGSATISVVSSGTYVSLALGNQYTCGRTTSGFALCWGTNYGGTLGNGTIVGASVPVGVAGGLVLSAVAVGPYHACGLTPSGTAYCWGSNELGKLGTGSATGPEECGTPVAPVNQCSTVPAAVSGGLKLTAIGAGSNHSCALSAGGAAYCWGTNESGELGIGSTTGGEQCGTSSCSTVPIAVAGELTFTALAVGGYHTCALTTAGAAFCWGDNEVGQVGDGTTSNHRATPTAVAGGLTFVALSAGVLHTCGLTLDGTAYCWGTNHLGQLGVGTLTGPELCPANNASRTTPCSTIPVEIPGSPPWIAISAGSHTCAVTTAGDGYCWGDNSFGALGIGTATGPQLCGGGADWVCSPTPIAVTGGLTFADISVPLVGEHSCGVTLAGLAYCWGHNGGGELGNGSPGTHSSVPVRVAGQP
jgi:Big-like domain-containing protein/Regulator of Chromosome Condensation (RCC1) repeat protein